jgi:hypothetical protein
MKLKKQIIWDKNGDKDDEMDICYKRELESPIVFL